MKANYYHNMGTKNQNWLLIGFLSSCVWLSIIGLICFTVFAQQPDELKSSQEKLASELRAAKQESEALRRESAESKARSDSRFAALKKESEADKETRTAAASRLNQLLDECRARLGDRDREIAALKKNIKRRALLRILTFQF